MSTLIEGASAVEARGLFHIYRTGDVRTVALKGVDLDLESGTWTAVMGPSGSGKSTLLQAVGGLIELSAGSITADGRDLTWLAPSERATWRRENVGIVLQRDNLHPLLDLAENVALPLQIAGENGTDVRARVDALLEEVGLGGMHSHRVGQLSGGEAQRAAVAVALAPRPRVLLADEPTGELDEVTASSILDLLGSLVRDQGAAVLTVTHSDQVAGRADRILRMRDGRFVDGPEEMASAA